MGQVLRSWLLLGLAVVVVVAFVLVAWVLHVGG